MKVNYSVKGEKKGLKVILLHGWGGSINSLALLQDALVEKGYEVYNMDLPGFGESQDLSQPMSLEDYTSYIARFIKELKLEKAVLVGHSFGGKIAMTVGINNPELISGLVLINASGIKPQNSLKKVAYLIPSKLFGLIFKLPVLNIFYSVVRKIYYKLLVREQDYFKASPVQQKTMQNVVNTHLDNKVSRINSPTLIIWGSQDKQTPLWQGRKLATLIPNSRLEIVDEATHGLPLKQPAVVANLISMFLGF